VLTIDGSMGEGGGQVLRSALALSLLTSTPFHIGSIRAGRARPGLMRQHLACVRAAARIGSAAVTGDELNSTALTFHSQAVHGGTFAFSVGSAGSTTLVFQTVLYPLLLATRTPSVIRFEGGTHNPMAPPVDYLDKVFLPLLARMGGHVQLQLERHGFYPAGGGAWSATIEPASSLRRLELVERGAIEKQGARAIVAQVPHSVALRELAVLVERLGWNRDDARPLVVQEPHGPGNALLATVESEHATEMFSAFGERGRRAEDVAESVATEVERYLSAGVPVGEHLADQLLLPLALGEGGVFRTLRPSLHTTTQIDLIRLFLGASIQTKEEAGDAWRIEVKGVNYVKDGPPGGVIDD
jgi:RNA 3'-terminal phosphate cyclase (ATP)